MNTSAVYMNQVSGREVHETRKVVGQDDGEERGRKEANNDHRAH